MSGWTPQALAAGLAAREGRIAARIAAGEKTCSRCRQTKPFDDFARHRYSRDGYGSWCLTCCAEQRKADRLAYRLTHPAKSTGALPGDGRMANALAIVHARNEARRAELADSPTLICSRCQEPRPRDAFDRDPRYLSGCKAWCRRCCNEYAAERRQAAKAQAVAQKRLEAARQRIDARQAERKRQESQERRQQRQPTPRISTPKRTAPAAFTRKVVADCCGGVLEWSAERDWWRISHTDCRNPWQPTGPGRAA